MKHHKWLTVRWPISMRSLADKLRQRLFEDRSYEGFLIDNVRDNYLEGRYVQRTEQEDILVDPFGNELRNNRVVYSQLKFIASDFFPELEIADPPRTQQRFLSLVSDLTDFSVAVNPVHIDVIRWAIDLQNYTGKAVIIDNIQTGSLEVDSGIEAKIIIKGDRDVQSALKDFTKDRKFTVEKLRLRYLERPRESIIMTSQGSARINCTQYVTTYEAVRNTLRTKK